MMGKVVEEMVPENKEKVVAEVTVPVMAEEKMVVKKVVTKAEYLVEYLARETVVEK